MLDVDPNLIVESRELGWEPNGVVDEGVEDVGDVVVEVEVDVALLITGEAPKVGAPSYIKLMSVVERCEGVRWC